MEIEEWENVQERNLTFSTRLDGCGTILDLTCIENWEKFLPEGIVSIEPMNGSMKFTPTYHTSISYYVCYTN